MPTTTSQATNLLVVDPCPDDYQELATELRSADYQLQFANCGDEALRASNVSPAGLWLINFQLPDMTGLELLTHVRSRNPDAACVLISDVYSAADELSARQFGATLYGCKPVLANWLYSIPALRQPRERGHPAHGPPLPRASPAVPSPRNVAAPPTQRSTDP